MIQRPAAVTLGRRGALLGQFLKLRENPRERAAGFLATGQHAAVIPACRREHVGGDAQPTLVKLPQGLERLRLFRVGRLEPPAAGLLKVLAAAFAPGVQHAQLEHGIGVAVFGGALIPLPGLGKVLFDAPPQRITGGQAVRSHGMIGLGCGAVVADGQLRIGRHTFAVGVHVAQAVERLGLPLRR